ncbi:heavy-metal-associated domain-containing protein [Kitasatospora sp. DSM 101779]|uniref:heavy-metal-associated domain-containing protein n=1 Tax=Kitasatospora sp. DSM 101779 TaxID=2853165 RepID=UPI0021DB1090|nr:cation transporter [Kitasatospora sp. DSM 101779]MCU7820722.1 cation transporter [Kitasatospora sp. DSM 101779]
MSTTAVFSVEGMSCGHCERTVTAGLAALPGVTGVNAHAATGQVTVESAGDLDESMVRSVVGEAGFTLVGRV